MIERGEPQLLQTVWTLTTFINGQLCILLNMPLGLNSHRKLSESFIGQRVTKTRYFLDVLNLLRRLLGKKYFGLLLRFQKWRGSYEIEVFKNLVKKGMFVLDVGANIGVFTLVAAKKCGKKGKVYSFEPEPNNLSALRDNIRKSLLEKEQQRIEVFPLIISFRRGHSTLYVDSVHAANHSIFQKNIISGNVSHQVKTTTLDSFLSNRSRKIDLIKIDVEGAEGMVIDGAKKILQKDKPTILMEFWPEGLRKSGHQPKKFLKTLMKMGYKIKNIDSQKKRLEDVTKNMITSLCEADEAFTNLLLVPSK